MAQPSTPAAVSSWLIMTTHDPVSDNITICLPNNDNWKYNSWSPWQHLQMVDLATAATSNQSLQWSESTSTASVVMLKLVLTLRAGRSAETTHREKKIKT